MAFNAVCSAFTGYIIYNSKNIEDIQSITFWLMGSLGMANWKDIMFVLPISIICIILFLVHYRVLNIMLMGDNVAITLGLDIQKYRKFFLPLNAVLVGLAVYSAGVIGFVGLLIPHIVRIFCWYRPQRFVAYSRISWSNIFNLGRCFL